MNIGDKFGDYTLDKKLGESNRGVLYRAVHPQEKTLAIKILSYELTKEPKPTERLFNDLKAIKKLGHPHILECCDFGFLPNQQAYLAMDFLEGQTLKDRLSKVRSLPEAEVLPIAVQVLEALGTAHNAKILHLELNPSSIFLIQRENQDSYFVKLLDFGMHKLSLPGTVCSVPARYLSPEQARDERQLDPRTDIYSMGITLYEMLVGQAPFNEQSYLGYLVAHQRKMPIPLRQIRPDLSAEVEAIVMKCLEKDVAKRYASAEALRDALIHLIYSRG